MNKSVVTNLIALSIVVGGCFSPAYNEIILTTGLFALSGGITNWLAVHMLFDRVPLLYGSGVILNQFEEFKAGIKQLMIQEFFTSKHIERFFKENGDTSAAAISRKIDFDRLFECLTEAIEESPMGSMLGMLGGKEALQPLKDPVTEKLKGVIAELALSQPKETKDTNFTSILTQQMEQIIDNRLQELTPEKVKNILQNMIRKHLGWLVVWGGVFGGVIGLGLSIAEYLS